MCWMFQLCRSMLLGMVFTLALTLAFYPIHPNLLAFHPQEACLQAESHNLELKYNVIVEREKSKKNQATEDLVM